MQRSGGKPFRSLWAMGLAAGALTATLVAAWLLGDQLAAVLTVVAIFTATFVGWQGTRAAERQARQATAAVLLDNRPLLVPVHDLAGAGIIDLRNLTALWPAKVQPGAPMDKAPGSMLRIFAVNRNTRRAVLYLENAGAGPAVVITAKLRSLRGEEAIVRGTNCVSPGTAAVFVGTLAHGKRISPSELTSWMDEAPGTISSEEQRRLQAEWGGEELRNLDDRIFLLEVAYDDVFEEGAVRVMKAWFDPRDSGRWEVVTPLTVPLGGIMAKEIPRPE